LRHKHKLVLRLKTYSTPAKPQYINAPLSPVNFLSITLLATFLPVCIATSAPIQPVVHEAARPIPFSAVRLTGGPLKHAQDLDANYLLKLEPDRMLAYFRKRSSTNSNLPR
jgi:hypothetical protein